MKKKSIILSSIGIVIIAILIIVNPFKKDIWDINAENFKYSLQHINGNVVIDDFSTWTPFEWDTLFSFAPYTTKGEIYKTIGYKWVPISTTVSEEMNQIVFIKDGKVVCYLYGYPQDNKFGFDFGKYEGSHIKLTAQQKLSFKTAISGKNGVRYFNYIK